MGDDVGKPVGGNDVVGRCDRLGGAVRSIVGDDVGRLTGEEVGSSVGYAVASLLSTGDAEGVADEYAHLRRKGMCIVEV